MEPNAATPGTHVPVILVVDDDQPSRELLKAMIRGWGYEALGAENGEDALTVVAARRPDVVISDILMPEMDGFQLCMRWRADPELRSIPFMFCSADYVEPDDGEFALSLGATQFILKPLDPETVRLAIEEALLHGADQADAPNHTHDATVSLDILQRYNARLFNKLQQKVAALETTTSRLHRAMDGCLAVVSTAMELRDPYTLGHEERVAELASAIAERLGMTADEVETIRIASMLHDVGKIAIPIEILSKPGRISSAEFEIVKTHAAAGADILKDAEFDQPIGLIVEQHHERMNGSGYPKGLHGDDIMMAARIIAVADVVEAMSSNRPYRKAISAEATIDEIRSNAGTLYDSSAAEACVSLLEAGDFAFKPSATGVPWR